MTITARRKERVQAVLQERMGSLVVVVEAVYRRHNTSALLRSAEAFGVHEVHLITGGFRPSEGAARGAERWLDLHKHGSTEACFAALRDRGFSIWVADLTDESKSPDTVPVDQPIAVVLGAELTGVSDTARRGADGFVRVPMRGMTESLNVSVAGGCIIGRLAERRRTLVGGGDLAPERQRAFFDQWLARQERADAGLRGRVTL